MCGDTATEATVTFVGGLFEQRTHLQPMPPMQISGFAAEGDVMTLMEELCRALS